MSKANRRPLSAVLIADFPDACALGLAQHLLASGYGVHIAKNAIPAAAQLENDGFFAVLQYVRSGEAPNPAQLQHLRRSASRPLLVVLDPQYCSARCIAYLDLGFDTYLPLGYSYSELEIRLKHFIQRQQTKGCSLRTSADSLGFTGVKPNHRLGVAVSKQVFAAQRSERLSLKSPVVRPNAKTNGNSLSG